MRRDKDFPSQTEAENFHYHEHNTIDVERSNLSYDLRMIVKQKHRKMLICDSLICDSLIL